MSNYRSCHSVEGEIFFNHLNKVGYCCMLTPDGGQPILYENYCGELIDWNDFFYKREKHIELMKNGSSLPECKNCFWIKNADWDERKNEFRYILLNIWVKCNLFCIYCSTHSDRHVIDNTKEYNIIPVIKDMIDKGVLTENTKIDIAGGEATLDSNFNELLSILIEAGVKNININTNATIFSKSIQDGVKKGVISIICSVDAGTSKKFLEVKKVNCWDKAWTNLNNYSSNLSHNSLNTVRAKYIIIPNINDKKFEIRKFLLKSKQNGIKGVILNIDLHWLRQNATDTNTMERIIDLTRYFIKVSNVLQLEWQVWAHIEDLIKRYNSLNSDNQIDISFIFNKTKYVPKNFIEKILNKLNFFL